MDGVWLLPMLCIISIVMQNFTNLINESILLMRTMLMAVVGLKDLQLSHGLKRDLAGKLGIVLTTYSKNNSNTM